MGEWFVFKLNALLLFAERLFLICWLAAEEQLKKKSLFHSLLPLFNTLYNLRIPQRMLKPMNLGIIANAMY